MNDYSKQKYLVIRPNAPSQEALADDIEVIMAVTGLDIASVKLKFSGSAIDVAMISSDSERLKKVSGELGRLSIPSVIVGKDEIRDGVVLHRATSVELGSRSIRFISRKGEDLLKLDGSGRTLIVLSTMNFERLNTKRIARGTFNKNNPLTADDILSFIFRNKPIMDIYREGLDYGVRVNGTRFNFTSLGDENRGSVALNFPKLIEGISKFSTEAYIDTGFGEKRLPFLRSLDEDTVERHFKDFEIYSFVVSKLYASGIFTAIAAGTVFPLPPVIKELGGLLWGGAPFFVGSEEEGKKKKEEESSEEPIEPDLPIPPEGMVAYGSGIKAAFFTETLPSYLRKLRQMGPAFITYPLALISILFIVAAVKLEVILIAAPGIISTGLLFFIYSFELLSRKRAVENCPTSKIKTMPMGEVEVNGVARQKYLLKSPYTLTDCVYYSYKVYQRVETGDGSRNVLKEWGRSDRLPFYLGDDTGQVMIEPNDAVIKAGHTERIGGDTVSKFISGHRSVSSGRFVVETVIPAGSPLYVMGYAHRTIKSGSLHKQTTTDRLRELKHDRQRLMKYDTNKDGKIDTEEWDKAREDVEHQVLDESLRGFKDYDSIAIGAHPTGGLFFISDKHEKGILFSFAWRIPVFLILGATGTAAGVFFSLPLIKNKELLMELFNILR